MTHTPCPDNRRGAGLPLPLAVDELAARCMGSVAVATLLLGKLENELPHDLREIEQHLAAGDAARVAGVVHSLKGAAGAVGAPLLQRLAAEIETLARQEQLGNVAQELTALRTEVERVLDYLPAARAALSTHGGPAPTEVTR